MRRMAAFVFWEKDGIVRDYIFAYLKGLKEISDKIYVVVNGDITEQGKKSLEEMDIVVLQRPNEGVDFWAYKTALDCEGDIVSQYDEIILCNCSCYGPIYPFQEMFDKMQEKEIDFWGITEWPINEGGYRGTWVLSYFMVFRPHVFLSQEWKNYWENLSPIFSREECIEKHETKFTQYFADKGFTYDVYCRNSANYIDSTIEAPDKLVIDQRCPIIKRKAFCAEYERFISYHRGDASRRVFDYIRENNLYDVDMILADLLQTQHYAYVKDCLQLNYVLPSKQLEKPLASSPKIVVCFHVYYEDLLDTCFCYMQSIPSFADIVITTPKKDLLPIIQDKIKDYNLKRVSIKLISARGRAESAFLVATKDFILNYDYACIVHDKKSSFLRPGCIGIEFGLHNQDALLATRAYIENILNVFEENPRLGILEPMNLVFANYRGLYGQEWGANFTGTVDFLKRSGVNVPIAANIPPITPMGAMFWFRPKCLQRMIEMDWEYEDFPDEPLPLDGSLIHIIERAYPFFAQEAGYLVGWVSTIEDAQVHITNLSHLLRRNNLGGPPTENSPTQIGVKGALKNYLRKKLPPKLWIYLKWVYCKLGGKPV